MSQPLSRGSSRDRSHPLNPRLFKRGENRAYARLAEGTPGQSLSIDDFAVLDTLGQGGFGTVLLAEKKADQKLYALKEISKRTMNSKEQAEQVLAETEALLELRHPLIISLFAAFQDASHVYFLLEYAEGGTLMEQLLKRETKVFEEEWCRFYTAQVAEAISHVHAKGFVYRDLKLDNVLVSTGGHIKLADFGLATRVTGRNLTALAGTPHMLAPEVLSKRAHGKSVDWWGVGLVLCEMLLGKSPMGWVCGPEDLSALPNTFAKKLHLPAWQIEKVVVSHAARQVVERFLEVSPTKRLCCTTGIDELRRCEWFAGADFSAIAELKAKAPLAEELARLHEQKARVPKLIKTESSLKARDAAVGTTVCEAAARGDIKEIRAMLAKGVPIDAGDYDQRTALHVVCSTTDLSSSKDLKRAGSSSLKMAKFLVEECGASVNAMDRWGFTPLQDAVRSGRSPLIAYLSSKGAHNGTAAHTDIFRAAASGDLSLLRRLIAGGVDVNQGDYDGRRALHVAASNGLLEVVTFLIDEAGATHSVADRWGNTPLGNAMFAGQEEVVDFLQSRGATAAIQAKNDLAANIFNLNTAATKGDLPALRRLVKNGVDVNEGDYDSRRPLHLASSEGLLAVVKFLVDEAHADVAVQDRWGSTPLADAVKADKTAVAKFLRSRGADEGKPDAHADRPTRRDRSKSDDNGAAAPAAPKMKLLPDPLVCPLVGSRFECPMVAPDGFTYEHAAFEAWTAKHGLISPLTGEVMSSATLVPNRVVDAMLRRRAARREKGQMEKPPPMKKMVPQALAMCCVLTVVGSLVGALEMLTFVPHDRPVASEEVTVDKGGSDFSFMYDDSGQLLPNRRRRQLLLGPGVDE